MTARHGSPVSVQHGTSSAETTHIEVNIRCLLWLVHCVVLPYSDVGTANVTAGAELDTVLGHRDVHLQAGGGTMQARLGCAVAWCSCAAGLEGVHLCKCRPLLMVLADAEGRWADVLESSHQGNRHVAT